MQPLTCSTVSMRLCIKLVTASSSSSNLERMWLCVRFHELQQMRMRSAISNHLLRAQSLVLCDRLLRRRHAKRNVLCHTRSGYSSTLSSTASMSRSLSLLGGFLRRRCAFSLSHSS
jgi:hypothetical protein